MIQRMINFTRPRKTIQSDLKNEQMNGKMNGTSFPMNETLQ
jgi:hypothetical protein